MHTQRYKLVRPVEVKKISEQIAQGITATIVGQSPDLYVDIALSDDSATADLSAYMSTLGWEFVSSNPDSPRPTLAPQFQPSVISKLSDPPISPASGDRYIVSASATGSWAGHENEISEWDGSAWQFTAPVNGMETWDASEREMALYAGSWEASAPRELAIWSAAEGVLTSSNPPTLVVRNEREMLAYAKSGSAVVSYFTGVVPRSYIPMGPLRVKIFWVAATAISGDVRWTAAFERLQPNGPNVDSNNFGADKGTNESTNPTNGLINSTIISFDNTEADGIQPGNPFRLRVRRQSNAPGDTMAGDAQVMRVVVVQ